MHTNTIYTIIDIFEITCGILQNCGGGKGGQAAALQKTDQIRDGAGFGSGDALV